MAGTKALDTLVDDAAAYVRQTIRDAKSLKGVTSQAIANHLGWDRRQVTSALVDSSRLRAPKAAALLKALSALEPQDRAANRAIEAALGVLRLSLPRPLRPAVLVPKSQVPILAAFLADTLAKRPGVGKALRQRLETNLRAALSNKRGELTDNFLFWFRIRTTSATAIGYDRTLSELGDPARFRTIFRARGFTENSETAGARSPRKNAQHKPKRGKNK
jgi:hypothetical protein